MIQINRVADAGWLQRKVAILPRREDAVGRGTRESSMNKPGLDNRHRNKDGEISHKHGNTLVRTLRKIYGAGFAAGYPDTEKLSNSSAVERNVAEPAPPGS